MAERLRESLPSIPPFISLEMTEPSPERLSAAVDAACHALEQHAKPEESKRLLFVVQQQFMDWDSYQHYREIRAALHTDNEKLHSSRKALPAAGKMRRQALARLYQAILDHGDGSWVDSPEDRDLWAHTQRWKRYEKPLPEALREREETLLGELACLRILPAELTMPGEKEAAFHATAEEASLCAEAYATQFRSVRAAREEQLLDLLETRRQLAQTAGFACYADYYQARRGKREWTLAEHDALISAWLPYLRPLYNEAETLRRERLGHTAFWLPEYLPLQREGEPSCLCRGEERSVLFRKVLAGWLGSPDHFFLEMLDKGYYTVSAASADRLGASYVLLEAIPAVFLALPLASEERPLASSILSAGQGLAALSAMLNYHSLGASPQDHFSTELSAYALLSIAAPEYPRFYGEEAALALDSSYLRLLLQMPWQIARYGLERWAYTQQDLLSGEALEKVWQELYQRFLSGPEEDPESRAFFLRDGGWAWAFPDADPPYASLLSLEALLTVEALLPHHAPAGRLARILNAYLLTNPGSPLEERLQRAGFPHWQEARMLEKAAFSLMDRLAL